MVRIKSDNRCIIFNTAPKILKMLTIIPFLLTLHNTLNNWALALQTHQCTAFPHSDLCSSHPKHLTLLQHTLAHLHDFALHSLSAQYSSPLLQWICPHAKTPLSRLKKINVIKPMYFSLWEDFEALVCLFRIGWQFKPTDLNTQDYPVSLKWKAVFFLVYREIRLKAAKGRTLNDNRLRHKS